VGGPNNDTAQDNAKQVWPTQASDCSNLCVNFGDGTPNCASLISNVPTSVSGVTNLYCNFGDTSSDSPYTALTGLLNSYKTDPNRTPDANGNGRTPLADAMCRALNQVRLTNTTIPQTITFESDGLENNSALGDCGNFTIDSTATPFSTDPNSVWQKSLADWGMSAAKGSGAPDALDSTLIAGGGSWEARVVRRMLRLTTASSTTATNTSIAANEVASSNIAWRVNAHYTTFSGTSTSPLALSTTSTTQALAINNTSSDRANVQAQKFTMTAAQAGLVAPTSTAATTTVTLSIPAAELAMMRQIGSPSFPSKGTGAQRSYFQAITQTPGQTFGTTHKLAGDVDDSGCVDRADFSIIMQRDVWHQRAVLPLQIAIRADLTRDGWVNEADRAVVLANWGHGCINNPGPKPTI